MNIHSFRLTDFFSKREEAKNIFATLIEQEVPREQLQPLPMPPSPMGPPPRFVRRLLHRCPRRCP